ncbi:hypothetical protein [Streptomyces kanamyceticus]|uniref:hypothetical protein n=1 Tax=Streptomyces kanamyceticus TaxID=1967 RepID=UPI0007C77BAF
MAETGVPGPVVVPRWVRWAAHGAALSVLPSGLWRIAIAFGWDSGFGGFLAPANFPGPGSFYLIGLSLFAEALGLLTLGLVHRWGEVLPGWVPSLGGRRIPTAAAVVPAALGAAAVTLVTVSGALTWTDSENMGSPDAPDGALWWVMTLCYAPLLAWGPLLGAVTVAYGLRRRRGGHAAGRGRGRERGEQHGGVALRGARLAGREARAAVGGR